MLREILKVCYCSREESRITCSSFHTLFYCMGKLSIFSMLTDYTLDWSANIPHVFLFVDVIMAILPRTCAFPSMVLSCISLLF